MLLVVFSRLLFKAYRIESKRYAQQLPNSGFPEKSQAVVFDEVYSFIGNKKHALILAIVDRTTCYILSWNLVIERTSANVQAYLEEAPQARYH